MENNNKITKVGVGVMILKDGKVLMAKRKGALGAGEYGFPGGHLEYMESFEDCAIRETQEETGIEIKNIRFLFVANVKKYNPKHYVYINMIADWASGDPQVMEPDKAEGWDWYSMDNLPQGKAMEFEKPAFDAYKNNINYFKEI